MGKIYRITVLFLVLVSVLVITACQKTIVTLQVGFVLGKTAREQEVVEKQMEADLLAANQSLEEAKESYRLAGEVVPYSECGQLNPEVYDILIWQDPEFSLVQAAEEYIDLKPELENGVLKSLYESMPSIYWESVKSNEKIYNIVRGLSNKKAGMVVTKGSLETMEGVQSVSLSEWERQFADIYENNQQKPFLMYGYGSGAYNEPAIMEYCFQNEFRMITPYLGISLNRENAKVECVYESEYAEEMKNWWVRQGEKGYIVSSANNSNFILKMDTNLEICYPFTATSGYGNQVYPFSDTLPIYAEVRGLESCYTLIPRNAPHLAETFQFLNLLATNEELAQGVVSYYLSLCPQRIWLNEDYDNGARWQGSVEKTRAITEKAWERAYLAPYSDFVFDETPVKEQYEAVEELFASFNRPDDPWGSAMMPWMCTSMEEWSSNWEANVDMLLEQLYDAGMQDIIDEANRQLGLE